MRESMSTIALLLLSIGLLGGTALAQGPKGAGGPPSIKCWTNKEGVRECGTVVPPEYIQEGHTEMRGVSVQERPGARSAEELEQERREKAEREEQERLLRARQAAQLHADTVLLHTFTNEDDLRLARDGRTAVIDSRIKLTEARAERLEANLRDLERQAAQDERGGKPVPDALRKDIARIQRELAGNRQYIEERQREKAELIRRFEADVARFRDLKSKRVQPGELPPETP